MEDIELIDEAVKLVQTAQDKGIILRILGAIAVRIHAGEFQELHKKLGRLGNTESSFTDLDLIGYSSQRHLIRNLMEKELKFYINPHFLLLHGRDRLKYFNQEKKYNVDVFLDSLNFSHTIFFGKKPGEGRLELDSPTITISDLLLEKLQIHEINEKDIKDIIVLLRAHKIAFSEERDSINLDYILRVLNNDWEFWYEAVTNLNKVAYFAEKYVKDNLLSPEDLVDVTNKIKEILSSLNNSQKSKKWLERAKIGTKKKWWRDVEEIFR